MWKRQWFVPVAVGLILLVTLAATIGGLLDSAAFLALIGVALGALLSDYSTQRSGELERTHQLRLAALDRRLQAHQDAYALWRRLLFNVHDSKEASRIAGECQEWWDRNCLYLEPRAREAFSRAYLTAPGFEVVKKSGDLFLVKAEFETIQSAGSLIAEGVQLPAISKGEDAKVS